MACGFGAEVFAPTEGVTGVGRAGDIGHRGLDDPIEECVRVMFGLRSAGEFAHPSSKSWVVGKPAAVAFAAVLVAAGVVLACHSRAPFPGKSSVRQ
jgi:hypothetical protein